MKTRKNIREKTITPPPIAGWVLRNILPAYDSSFLMGDFEEGYAELCQEKGRFTAWVWYWYQVFRAFPLFVKSKFIWSIIMFTNYLKIAIRNVTKHKSYSAINISGLAIGFTCCLVILLFIQDELSYDTFHEDGDRIFRIANSFTSNGKTQTSAMISYRQSEILRENFSEIEEMVTIDPTSNVVTFDDTRISEQSMAFVHDKFFELFTLELPQGNKETVLDEPNTVVITENIAEKYFGSEDPIGKVFDINDGSFQLKVTGVMKEIPANSHFHFDFLISLKTGLQLYNQQVLNGIGENTQFAYVRLPEGYDPKKLEDQFPNFLDTNIGPGLSQVLTISLQPLPDIHLKSRTNNELETNSDESYIYIFGSIALMTLLIACINYMNLATARSMRRSREVGLRKVLGAHKIQLIKQFLGESIIITFMSLCIATAISFFVLPLFNDFTGKQLSIDLTNNIDFLAWFVLSTIGIGIIAGSYPAFFLSAFQPLKVIKGVVSRGNAGTNLRRVLVVLQFCISVVLITGTVVVFNQLDFLRNKKLGYESDQLVVVPFQTMNRQSQYPVFKEQLLSDERIKSVGASNKRLTRRLSSSFAYRAENIVADPNNRSGMRLVTVDHDFFNAIENEFAVGRSFSREYSTDANEGIILNESAIALLGWDEPIGKWFETADLLPSGSFGRKRGKVVGVIKDFHYESLYNEIAPVVFSISDSWLNWIYIRIDGNDVTGAINYIEDVYGRFVTNRDFFSSFLDEDVERLYNAEERFLTVFSVFTTLAIGIACLGIFGLASFTAERRTKEIGIRKVLGATVSSVLKLLIKEFTNLILIANIIAWPIGYYLMNNWLQGFTYRTPLGIGVFFFSFATAVLIALVTVLYQARKAAVANPVDALRYE